MDSSVQPLSSDLGVVTHSVLALIVISLCLGFLICKLEVLIILTSKSCFEA